MNRAGSFKIFSAGIMLLVAAWTSAALAQGARGTERQKIEALIARVEGLSNAKFIRNGKSYDSSSAVRFLRGKWQANAGAVQTARDFIDKVASASGTSNQPYRIRFNDGQEITSRDFLIAELKEIELRLQASP